MTIGSSI